MVIIIFDLQQFIELFGGQDLITKKLLQHISYMRKWQWFLFEYKPYPFFQRT